MTPERRRALRAHLADAFEREHREAPRRRRSARLTVVGLCGLLAYGALVVDAVRSGPDRLGLLVRR